MKDLKLNSKKLKVDYNRILVSEKGINSVNCLLISIAKKLKGFAVYIKHKGINFKSLSVMNVDKFMTDSLEDANSFSMRVEAYFINQGFLKLKDSKVSTLRLRSRIGDELSRGWKESSCDESCYFFTEYQVDRLREIASCFNMRNNDEELYASCVKALMCDNYDVKNHKACVFNCYIDIIMGNDCILDAVCVDNSGYEDEFDLNVSYVIDGNARAEFLKVYDKFGVRQELSQDRFKLEISVE